MLSSTDPVRICTGSGSSNGEWTGPTIFCRIQEGIANLIAHNTDYVHWTRYSNLHCILFVRVSVCQSVGPSVCQIMCQILHDW